MVLEFWDCFGKEKTHNQISNIKSDLQPYRGGNQESADDRDRERSQPSVSFELDSSPSVTQYQGGNENQSEQTVSQSKPPLVRKLFALS